MSEGTETAGGRSQLQTALSDLVLQAKQEDSLLQAINIHDEYIAVDDDVRVGARGLMGLQSPRRSMDKRETRIKGGRSPKKKRRKVSKQLDQEDYTSIVDASSDNGQHVMTFFDRKVDLAQFDEDTPLYVMCREWMRNNPADSVGGAYTPGLQDASREQTQNGEGEGGSGGSGMSSEAVYQLPEPTPYIGASKHSRIPVPLPNQTGKLDGSIDQDLNIVGLRAANMRHWKDVRKRWKEASLVNQQRYAASVDILRGLYVPPEAPCLEQQPMIP